MATSIEQIFRSYVVTKFREIQEQQYGGGKVGSQQNGEINSSEQVSPSDDEIVTIGNLQNDPLVQKIEQVLSEVLGTESQYKPDDGEDTAKNKSRSSKRGLSEEVEVDVEVSRKKSKKEKKHKDKKKKKKRKKEKKYKKQSKESKLNDEHKEFGDSVPDSKAENLNFLSSEDVDIGSASPLKQGSEWFMEKNSCENLNSTMSNSCDAFSSENSKLDTSEEDSVSINIQELSEIKLTNEKENEQHTDLAVHPYSEDESLNIVAAESGVCMDRDEVTSTAEIKPSETSSGSKAEEKVTAPENSPESTGHEVEHLGTSLEPGTVEIGALNASRNLEFLHPETIQQSVPILADKSDCKFMKLPLETVVEAKDSVTTLGFLAMVVGKDFEATSEFLNTAKVKASERSPKGNTFIDKKDPSSEKDSDGTVIVTEKRLLEETSEPLRAVNENDFEPSLGHKHQPKVLKRIPESDARKRTEATLYPEALKETQASAITMAFKESSPSLLMLNKMDSGEPLSDPTAEVKNLKAASEFKEMDTRCLKAKSESENWQTVPYTLRKVDVRNRDRSPESEKKIQRSYLEKPLETVMEERESYAVAKDTETVAKLKASERFSRSGTAPEINDIKTTPGTPDILKTQYQEVSKYAGETDVESGTLAKQKGFEKLPESLLMVKNVQSISESQYVKEIKNMNDVLQSEVVAQRKESEISLVLEEKDSDATSGSLHMIFTNYSEPSLENDTESEAMMELKTLESVPELPSMVDANKSKELHAKEIKDLKSVESEAIIKLNDLEKKLKSLHRDVKKLEMPIVKSFQTLVAPEATAKRKSNETVSHSVSEIEKVSDTIKYMEKDQTVAEAAGFKILPERQKMTENEPSAKTEGLLFSKSLEEKDVVCSEATPELGAIAMIQKLKEAVDFTAGLDVGSPKKSFVLETTVSTDSQEPSTTVNIAKDFESVSECHAEQSPAPFQTVEVNKTKGTEVILDSLYDFQVKFPVTSSEFLLSSELGSLEKKKKLKERAETAGSTAAPEPLYAFQRDQIVVPDSDEVNRVVNTEHGPESSYLAKTNSENVLKSLYMVEVKDSKSHLGSTFIDVKDVEMESETTLKEGVEIVGDLPECKSVVAPEILEITSDSPKKIEMLFKPQYPPVLHVPNAAFAITDVEANSETIHIINIENLEASSEREESEVKTAEIVPTSLFAVEMMDSIATPTSGHIVEDKESKAIKAVVNLKASRDSMDILEPTCITNVKETNQNLETNLDYLIKEEINNTYTKSAHEVDASGSQTIQRCMPVVDIHISEGLLTAVDNTVKKNSGPDLKPETRSVVRYSESVCQPENVLEREDYDTAIVLMEIKDSGASSGFLDTGKTTPQLETISQRLYEFKSRDSADAGEAVSTAETKGLGRTLNSTTELEVQDAVASGTHLNTSELKSSDSVLEVTVSEGIVEVKTAPTYPGATKVFQSPGTTTETQSSETGTEYMLNAYDYNAASESESGMVKVSENVEIVATSKDAQEIKGMKSSPQSLSTMEVRDLEKSIIFEEVPDVSETSQQFSGNAEIKVLKVITPSAVAEPVKDSEKQLKLQLHLKEKCKETLETGYSILYSEPKNSEANSGFIGTVDSKDTERPVKSTHAVESVHSKAAKDFQTTPKCGSVGEINVLQVQTSARKEQGLDLEGISKSTVTLERHDLERNLLSVIVSEEKTPEESLESSHGVKAKDSEVLLKCKNGKDVDVLEQNMAEMKNLESAPEWDVLSQAKTSEIIPKITSEVKDSGAILEPLSMTEEKDLGGKPQISLEEQVLKATLKPVCTGAESNLQANQQLTVELKDSQAAAETVCMAEKMNLEVGKMVTIEVKGSETPLESVHTAKEKDLEATADVSLKDQDSQATPQTSDKKEQNEGSILKDKKSEKVSSKSKDKSKSGKRAKKSRSKSPSKSKKHKKKSRSHSTSRRVASRRGRSRSRDDSNSRKKHSSSRHKSRSKSVDKKDSKESSLRSRRRRSRTSDRHKSRSRSVEIIRSRWRRSRSSDHRKSRSRSIDKSARRKRRLSRSSEKHKSRSKSVDRREARSRRRRSRSSDHRKSRSQSVDKTDTSVRTRRRRSRSSDRSRSVDKRDTSARRRRRRSRTLDNVKSRSKSLDRRESSIRSRRRRSRSSDRRKSRSRSVDDKRDTSLRTRRKRSRSLDNRKSRSRSADKETSVRTRRRRSRSSDNRRSKSKSVDKRESSVRTRRKRSRSLDNRKSRSKSVDKRDSSVRARRRRSRSSDIRKSRSRSADKRETSVRTRRKRSRSSDNHKSRSRSLNKGDTSVRARRKWSRSSDHLKSRSRSVDKRETTVRTRRRRSRSSDTHKSRSKSVDKREASVKTRQRRSRSLDKCKSRSKSPDKRDTSVRTKRRQSHSSDTRKSRSKSLDKKETLARSKRKRSRSCDSQKSRSKSVDKTETLTRSKRQRSQSPDQKSRTKSDEKDESSLVSKSSDRQRSKSKSRSKSSDRKQDKETSDSLREKCSKSRSKSLEKTEGTGSLEAPVCNRTKSPEHQKSKSRSRSKSLDKTKRERSRRSKSKGSKSPELKSRRHRTVSRSRQNRSPSLTRKRTSRSKSNNRSRTRSRTRSRSCTRRWRRTRSRSVSRQRSLSRERRRRSRRNRSRSTERRRRRSDSRDSYRVPLRLRSRSRTPARLRSTGRRRSASKSPDHRRSSSRSPKRLTELDKAQLLEIAKANAAAMCAKAGMPLPASLMPSLTPDKKEEKVVQKTAKETIMELTEKCKKIAQSQEDDLILNKPHVSDEEEEEHPFINHPFKLNEPKPIFFNLGTPSIKPAPPKTQVTLTKEFPVSSGSQHRKKEADSAYGEWVPVEKNKDENTDDVFPNPASLEPVDISSALNERTIAQKRLTENTFDLEAMCLLNRAQERIDAWAQLNSLPGQFTGSTGAQVLTSEQLSNSGPQAWIKKDQFLRAAPVSGGMGAQLMRKMGWREGEGLGKNREGNKEPILVDFKTDRKGLVAVGEKTKRHGLFSAVKDLSGKHPVSLLVEACNKRRWSPPVFVLVHDNGPEHRKHFVFKVMVNGVEHKPTNPSPNKKHAKAAAATVALQALGILPKELMANATSFRSASRI